MVPKSPVSLCHNTLDSPHPKHLYCRSLSQLSGINGLISQVKPHYAAITDEPSILVVTTTKVVSWFIFSLMSITDQLLFQVIFILGFGLKEQSPPMTHWSFYNRGKRHCRTMQWFLKLLLEMSHALSTHISLVEASQKAKHNIGVWEG